MKKIDIHMHCFRQRPLLPHTGTHEYFMTPEEVLEVYSLLGIEKGILLPFVSPECANAIQGNEEVMNIAKLYPERFYWFCNIDPRNQTNTSLSDFSSMIDVYRDHGALGVGEITANLPFDDPLVENLFRCCEIAGMPVLFHIGTQKGSCYGLIDEVGLPLLEKSLNKFPDLLFIGHSQPFWCEISAEVTIEERNTYPQGPVKPGRLVELLRRYPNLLADLSANSGFNALKRDEAFACDFIEEFQNKLFFGTDICDRSEHIGLSTWLDNMYTKGSITKSAYEKICRRNAERLLL